MLNLPLLGLPYVQPTSAGILLLRSNKVPVGTLRIFRFGSVICTRVISLLPKWRTCYDFRLEFPEYPHGLASMIFVEADFGPRVSYIAIPLTCRFPITRERNDFVLSSREMFGGGVWRDIIVQVNLVTAQQRRLIKKKLMSRPPSTFSSEPT